MRLDQVHACVEQDVTHRHGKLFARAGNFQPERSGIPRRLLRAVRGERQNQAAYPEPRFVAQLLRLPKIDDAQGFAILTDEHVPGVRVGVEPPDAEDLRAVRFH